MARFAVVALIAFCGLCPAQTPDGTGSVEGTVLDAITGAPLRKAGVSLTLIGPNHQRRRAVTGAGGDFVIEGLPPGGYVLHASHALYTGVEFQHETARGRTNVISLDPGERVRNLVIELVPTAVVTGSVVDADGDPVPGARVSAFQFQFEHGRRQIGPGSGSVRADDRGKYRLWGVQPARRVYIAASYGPEHHGDYRPAAEPEDGFVAARTFYPGVLDVSQTAPMILEGGEERGGIDIQLLRVRTYHVAGRVEGDECAGEGQGLAVNLTKVDDNDGSSGVGLRPGDREFALARVFPGSYIVSAECHSSNSKLYGSQRIEVKTEDVTDLKLRLRPPIRLAGALSAEPDPGGVSFSRLLVRLEPLEPVNGHHPRPAKVDKTGSFELKDLREGRYRLDIRGLRSGMYLKSATLGDRDLLEQGLDLRSDPAGKTLKLVISGGTATIEGSVRGLPSNSGERILVFVIPEGEIYVPGRSGLGVPGKDGRFVVRGLAAGRYRLLAATGLPDYGWRDPEIAKQLQGHIIPIEVAAGEQKSVELDLVEIAYPR